MYKNLLILFSAASVSFASFSAIDLGVSTLTVNGKAVSLGVITAAAGPIPKVSADVVISPTITFPSNSVTLSAKGGLIVKDTNALLKVLGNNLLINSSIDAGSVSAIYVKGDIYSTNQPNLPSNPSVPINSVAKNPSALVKANVTPIQTQLPKTILPFSINNYAPASNIKIK